jgi:hypothetical protein
MPLIYRQLEPATVQRARVLDVNTGDFTMVVSTEYTQKPLHGVSFATPYQHPNNGEGIYFMPEVGSVCWIMEPSDGGMPFAIAWTVVEDKKESYRGRKMDLNPGDIYLGTRDENHVLLRRGGVVEIGATPLAQRLYIPIDNVIRDLCANYFLQTLGGELSWTVGIPEGTRDGKRPTLLRLQAREFANDAGPIAQMQIGSHGDGDPTILSLDLCESGDQGAKVQVSLVLEKTGDVALMAAGDVGWEIDGDVKVEATNVTLQAARIAKLVGGTEADVEGGIVNIKSTSGVVAINAQGGVVVTSPSAGPALKVGDSLYPVLLATPLLLSWIVGHTHLCATPGNPGGPPLLLSSPLNTAPLQSQAVKAS